MLCENGDERVTSIYNLQYTEERKMVMVRTPYSRELFNRINFLSPAIRPQASTAFSSRLAKTTMNWYIIAS